MIHLKRFNEGLFSKSDDNIAKYLMSQINNGDHGDIHGPFWHRNSKHSYSCKIDDKKLEVDKMDKFLTNEYEVYYGNNLLNISNSIAKKIYDSLFKNKKV